ncbi:MAG: M48 family metallopeptidase [Armatimonadota bacterium]
MRIRYGLIVILLGAMTGALAGPFSSISPDKEMQIGREAQKAMAAQPGLSRNALDIKRVQRLANRLVEAMPVKKYPFEVTVLNSQEVNAFCLPGGFIDVYEGLLQRLPSDDAVAFVIAHEMAHASHGHWRKQSKMASIIGAMGAALDKTGLISGLVSQLIMTSYSRDDEREADATATLLVHAAGMDANGGLATMDALAGLDPKNSSFKMLRTHPPATERRVLIEHYIQQLPARVAKSVEVAREVSTLPSGLAPEANPYLPFAAGGAWAYTRNDEAGNAVAFYVTVTRSIPHGAGWYYRMARHAGSRNIEYEMLATKAELWRRDKPDDPNSRWHLDVSLVNCNKGGLRFISKGYEDVKLGCGEFPKSLHIRKEAADADESCELWLAKDVGVIRRVYDSGLTETLKSYTTGHGN